MTVLSVVPANRLNMNEIRSEIGSPATNLFDFKWSDHILNDIQWLRADTFSWQSGEVYKSAYEHLVEDYEKVEVIKYYCWSTDMYTKSERPNIGDILYKADGSEWVGSRVAAVANDYSYIATTGGPALLDRNSENDIIDTPTETIGSHTVTYYLAEDGHKIVLPDMEATVQNIYNETGVAWYYILDTTNQRFKLPRTKWGFTGIRDSVGNYIAESLPNITGKYGARGMRSPVTASGVFYDAGTYAGGDSGESDSSRLIGFDASRSSSAYQDGAPVQERATQMYLYFYVGNFTQSAIEQTAGITTEALNEKLDLTTTHIVETYVNGTSWYRVYSDGWCEQGGYTTHSANTQIISLLKTMANTDYTVFLQAFYNAVPSGTHYFCLGAKTTSTFTKYSVATGGFTGCYWQACGYMA